MSTPSGRILFVDVARAAAVVFMIQGHTLQVLLGPEYQGGAIFNFWGYLRGLTSCAFLMLAGFSFVVATDRYWSDYRSASPRLRRRLARFGGFLLLGYAMRIPIRPVTQIGRVTGDQWQAFTAVDILQLVAVMLAALQALVWLAGTRRRLGLWALAGTAAIVLLGPLAWKVGWTSFVPVFFAAYLSSATGSLFPLFPWAAYILFGAALGAWFVARSGQEGTGDASVPFLTMGATLVVAAAILHRLPFSPYGAIEFWRISPNLFLAKAGSVLLVLAAAVRLTRSRSSVPRVVSILSRESLIIYFVHVCILYGSIWNDGLFQLIGPRLSVTATAGWAVVLSASMALLAYVWHECKQRSVHLPPLIRAGIAVALFYAIA